jgi:hypothetical protein
MNLLLRAGIPIATLVLGWALNEVSHRWRTKDKDERERLRQRRASQSNALIQLQQLALEYLEIAQHALWTAWECSQTPGNKKLDAKADDLHSELEHKTLELFAARARVDDLRIRSVIDHLEEMSRQFIVMPGESIDVEGAKRQGERVVLEQDHQLEGFSWGLCGWVTRTRVRLGGVLSLGARLGRADGVGWPCLLGGLGCLGQCGDVET